MTQNELILLFGGLFIVTALLFITCLLLAIQYYKRWRRECAASERHRVSYHECNALLSDERRNAKELLDQGYRAYKILNDEYKAIKETLSKYTNHPDEVVRMALYPKQRLVVSTEGCPVGAGTVLSFKGALELEGDRFRIESPVKMDCFWLTTGLHASPLDPTQDIPAMDGLETFIYTV
jgi:hypothetical protein